MKAQNRWSIESASTQTTNTPEDAPEDGPDCPSEHARHFSNPEMSSTDSSSCSKDVQGGNDEVTTLMIRNLPCRCTQKQVRNAIEEIGFGSDYTLFYLPIRHGQAENLGYAFIGFFDKNIATAFTNSMNGYRFPGRSSHKSCDVVQARIQGLQANLEHFVLTHTMRFSQSGPLLQL
jgi:hypothetical protein